MDESVEHDEQSEKPKISENPESCGDLISDLPDEVLCHILSFLPTKFAVGTSILSTRWKNLFLLIPNLKLEFNDSLLLHHPNGEPNLVAESKPTEDDMRSFVDFVGRVLNRLLVNGARICDFKLICREGYSDHDILSLVDAAALFRVEYILLVSPIEYCDMRKLIGSLNGCTALNCLQLSLVQDFVLDLPKNIPVNFVNLKRLVLDGIYICERVRGLFDGCPVLEELVIMYCAILAEEFWICISSLKSLVLTSCVIDNDTIMVFDTPVLKYLYYYGLFDVSFSFISKLDRIVSLYLRVEYNVLKRVDLMNARSKIRVFDLSESTMEVLHHLSLPLPDFCKLRRLQVQVVGVAGWNTFGRLLKNASNVEAICIDKGSDMLNGCFASFQESAKGVPYCLSSKMKLVLIREFKGLEDEIKFVEYLLENGKVLKSVYFHSDFNWKENSVVYNRILEAERKSETCEIRWSL